MKIINQGAWDGTFALTVGFAAADALEDQETLDVTYWQHDENGNEFSQQHVLVAVDRDEHLLILAGGKEVHIDDLTALQIDP